MEERIGLWFLGERWELHFVFWCLVSAQARGIGSLLIILRLCTGIFRGLVRCPLVFDLLYQVSERAIRLIRTYPAHLSPYPTAYRIQNQLSWPSFQSFRVAIFVSQYCVFQICSSVNRCRQSAALSALTPSCSYNPNWAEPSMNSEITTEDSGRGCKASTYNATPYNSTLARKTRATVDDTLLAIILGIITAPRFRGGKSISLRRRWLGAAHWGIWDPDW
jgi:hypothetical protein